MFDRLSRSWSLAEASAATQEFDTQALQLAFKPK